MPPVHVLLGGAARQVDRERSSRVRERALRVDGGRSSAGPYGPVAPVAPVSSCSPVSPWGPVSPRIPCTPCGPRKSAELVHDALVAGVPNQLMKSHPSNMPSPSSLDGNSMQPSHRPDKDGKTPAKGGCQRVLTPFPALAQRHLTDNDARTI